MSSAPRYVPRYTVSDYASWEGNWELIDGVAVAMSPSPFGPHERVVSELARQLGNEFIACACPCRVYTNLDWIVTSDSVVRPDVMVVCGDQPSRHLERPPALVAEVLSDSTRAVDLTAKRSLYREHQVPHYLILDPDRRTVEWIRHDGSTAVPADAASPLQLDLGGDCVVRIDCGRLFD